MDLCLWAVLHNLRSRSRPSASLSFKNLVRRHLHCSQLFSHLARFCPFHVACASASMWGAGRNHTIQYRTADGVTVVISSCTDA